MKLSILFFCILPFVSQAKEPLWLSNFEEAKKIAKQENKPILMNFTGSDWCGWCIRLEGEVFGELSFKTFAEKNLVLMKLDFPSRKKLDKKILAANEVLAEKYGIQGYPTILIVDSEGSVLATTGYQKGGADNYVKHLKKLIDKNAS